jgi:hypothetical protein
MNRKQRRAEKKAGKTKYNFSPVFEQAKASFNEGNLTKAEELCRELRGGPRK